MITNVMTNPSLGSRWYNLLGSHRHHGPIKNVKTNKVSEIKIDGLFIAIGHDPATSLVKGQLDMDKEGYVITKPDSTITNIPGVFAAGDVKDKIFRQAVTAAGMGCMAALEAEKFLSH
jgi:thioredoxin reductase (NADPH)